MKTSCDPSGQDCKETCPYHNQAMTEIAAVEAKHAKKQDEQEAYVNMLHDKISTLTKRVEQLEPQHEENCGNKTFRPIVGPKING